MSKAITTAPQEQPLNFDPRWAGFASELVLWMDQPPRGDETQRAFATAAFTGLVEEDALRAGLHDLLRETWQHSDMGPSHTANLLHSAMEYQGRDDPQAPLQTPGAWRELLRGQLCDEAKWADVRRTMRLPLMTDQPQRSLVTHALSHALFGGQVRLLDAGGSRGHGLAALKTAALKPVEVMSIPSGEFIPRNDPEATEAINALLARPVDVETKGSIIVDMMNRERLAAWIKTCTLRGQEKLNHALVQEYDELDIVARGLPFYQANLGSNAHMRRFSEAVDSRPFEYVSAKTMLNSHAECVQRTILRNIRSQTTEGAVEEVADFALPDPQDPTRLKFIRHWFKAPFAYNVLIRRPPSDAWQLVASFDTSRGRRVLLHGGNVARTGEKPATLRELLLGRAALSK